MAEGIALPKPPLPTRIVTVQNAYETSNTWTIAAISGGVLLLYSLSRIIALQRRVRDLEARPPVDDIVMRGMIRREVSEMVTDLEQSIRARTAVTKTDLKNKGHKQDLKVETEPKVETKSEPKVQPKAQTTEPKATESEPKSAEPEAELKPELVPSVEVHDTPVKLVKRKKKATLD